MALQQEVSVKADLDDRSNTPDSVIMDDTQLVEELAADYNTYMNFDLSKEKEKFNESIEEMLTKLDEFCGLVDMIRSDISLCLMKTVPSIQAKCQEMEVLFEKIDKLEAFVSVVKQDVNKMEECVSKAEDQLGSIGGFMKKITSIVSPKRSLDSARSKQTEFVPPEIFHASKFFEPRPMTAEGATSSPAAKADFEKS